MSDDAAAQRRHQIGQRLTDEYKAASRFHEDGKLSEDHFEFLRRRIFADAEAAGFKPGIDWPF